MYGSYGLSGNCNANCPKNKNEICGGSNANSIYSTCIKSKIVCICCLYITKNFVCLDGSSSLCFREILEMLRVDQVLNSYYFVTKLIKSICSY